MDDGHCLSLFRIQDGDRHSVVSLCTFPRAHWLLERILPGPVHAYFRRIPSPRAANFVSLSHSLSLSLLTMDGKDNAEQHMPLVSGTPVMNDVDLTASMGSSVDMNDIKHFDMNGSNTEVGDNMLSYSADFEEQVSRPTKEYRDVFFLILWVLDNLVVLGIGIFAGVQCMSTHGMCMSANTNPNHSTPIADRPTPILGPIITAFVVSAIMCAIMIVLVQWYSEQFLKCLLLTSIVLQFVAAGCMFAFQPAVGVLILVTGIFTCCYYYWARNRLEFAGAMLETACSAIRRFPESVMVAFGSLFLQLLTVVVFALAYYGAVATTMDFGSFVLETFLLFSLFWTLQVIQNVAHCCTCGVVGTWWFTTSDKAVGSSLKRASTTSLGSICFGSLIVALLKMVRILISQFRRAHKSNNAVASVFRCVLHCAEYLLNVIEHYARYLNSYAYCFVALYGKDFRTSGREVQALFEQRGWTAVVNDDLVSTTLVLANFGVGAVAAFAGGLSSMESSTAWVGTVMCLSFFMGVVMSFTVTGVLTSAVRTVFVCYAKAPGVQTRPESSERLRRAWEKFHPTVQVHVV